MVWSFSIRVINFQGNLGEVPRTLSIVYNLVGRLVGIIEGMLMNRRLMLSHRFCCHVLLFAIMIWTHGCWILTITNNDTIAVWD